MKEISIIYQSVGFVQPVPFWPASIGYVREAGISTESHRLQQSNKPVRIRRQAEPDLVMLANVGFIHVLLVMAAKTVLHHPLPRHQLYNMSLTRLYYILRHNGSTLPRHTLLRQ